MTLPPRLGVRGRAASERAAASMTAPFHSWCVLISNWGSCAPQALTPQRLRRSDQ